MTGLGTDETSDRKPGFDTLENGLKEKGTPKAKALLKELKVVRKKATDVVTGEITEYEKEKAEAQKKLAEYITNLAFANGDTKNPKESLVLTELDVANIKDVGVGYHYMTDEFSALRFYEGGHKIPVTFPDGITGALLVNFNPKSGDMRAILSKNCTRTEEKKRQSAAA